MKVQIVLAGIGGQGILFASKLFSQLGVRLGLKVMGSEAHGMSQRGGSVIAQLKLGDFQSPLIRSNSADILYSFDENETYRTLKFLRSGGVCFANLVSRDRLDRKIVDHLENKHINILAYDASDTALKVGSIISTNIVLIGYSVGTGLVPFRAKDLKYVLELVSRKSNLEINLKAFESGFQKGRSLRKKP